MTSVDTAEARPGGYLDLASLLFSEPRGVLEVPSFAWGFGGLHGGLAMSLVASSMRRSIPEHSLRSITGQFHRPIRGTFAIESRVIRTGRSAGALQATGTGSEGLCLTATATFGSDQESGAPVYAPDAPDVPGPDSLPTLDLAEQIPVLSQVDLRPIGEVRPYAGAAEPTTMAWMRIKGREAPIDPYSVIFFLDGLPPSYTVVLTQPRPAPTLEFSAHVTSGLLTSQWLLVRARTVRASEGGWLTESIDAWDPDGAHLGSAQQLRLAVTPRNVV